MTLLILLSFQTPDQVEMELVIGFLHRRLKKQNKKREEKSCNNYFQNLCIFWLFFNQAVTYLVHKSSGNSLKSRSASLNHMYCLTSGSKPKVDLKQQQIFTYEKLKLAVHLNKWLKWLIDHPYFSINLIIPASKMQTGGKGQLMSGCRHNSRRAYRQPVFANWPFFLMLNSSWAQITEQKDILFYFFCKAICMCVFSLFWVLTLDSTLFLLNRSSRQSLKYLRIKTN